jgi:hypothetical protein
MKTFELISDLRWNPSEFQDRVSAILAIRWESSFNRCPDYPAAAVEKGMEFLLRALGQDLAEALNDPNLTQSKKLDQTVVIQEKNKDALVGVVVKRE